MSPASSLCYAAASTVTCKSEAEADQSASAGRRSSASSPSSSSVKAEVASTTMVPPAANDQNVRGAMVPPPPPPLKVAKDSHRIRKPAMPLPQVQYRPPIIIHTYSPKVIHTKPDDFISLVQKLTGSSDTRLRLKRANRSKKLMEKQIPSTTSAPNPNPGLNADHHHQSAVTCTGDVVNPATAPPPGPATVGPSRTGCGSPSSSEESTFLASEVVGSDPSSLKQSAVSPRGPLSNYEFENSDSIFSSLVEPPPAAFFSTSHVKSEPSGFPFCNDFNFLNCDFSSSGAPAGNSKAATITGATKGSSSSHRQAQNQHQHQHHHQHMPVDMLNNPYNIDINTPLMPTPGGGLGFYSNSELTPTTARWYSQQAANFMDSSSCLAHGGHLAPPGSSGGNYMQNNPTPILRQRELVRYAAAGGYCPTPEAGSTMVSLENIQAFMFS